MTSYKSNTPHDEPLTLVSLLKALGHEPVSTRSDEFGYASVFGNRTNNKIVLTVNNRLDTWFDSSLGPFGKGGNLLDFARTYWPELTLEEIKERLVNIQDIARPKNQETKVRRKRKAIKIPHYQIDRTRHLGYTNEITEYLVESGLWELADLNTQEVHYYVIDQKGKRKDFCAAGWQNENGGWEVRAQNYTGCIGTKGMTFIPKRESLLAVFPDYVDYLKRRNDRYMQYASVLVLNHSSFLSASIKRARRYENVLFHVDETREGYGLAGETFIEQMPQTKILPI